MSASAIIFTVRIILPTYSVMPIHRLLLTAGVLVTYSILSLTISYSLTMFIFITGLPFEVVLEGTFIFCLFFLFTTLMLIKELNECGHI